MSDLPTVTVIIPTYNRADVVQTTLEHLRSLDYPDERYEVLVLDNSSDRTPEMVLEQSRLDGPRIELVADTHPFPCVKRNMGVDRSRADLCWFINDDMWFEPQALIEHVRTHRAHDEPVAVLGHCRQSEQMDQTPFVSFYEPFSYELMAAHEDKQIPYQFFWSMNLTLPRRTMCERNLRFHEDWQYIGHEDVELGWRWTRAGLAAIYNPRARGEHFHPHTVDSAARLQGTIGRGLRDLEALVDDPELLDRYGVLHRGAGWRAQARGVGREVLFNRYTTPAAIGWLDKRERPDRLARWMYWKVLMAHLNRAYRAEPRRSPQPVPTYPEPKVAV
ncbi:MAG: glycosyltransferase family 2 protein [Acidimicrobiia bacterium]|nr:glycosyltransferase family 2 protein [Acidimicrobiia bacterium]